MGNDGPKMPESDFTSKIEAQQSGRGSDLAGGELVTPTAVRAGLPIEQGMRTAVEQGHLNAITSALHQEGVSNAQKQANIQEIVDRAKQAGVSSDALKAHVQSLGVTAREQTPQQEQVTKDAVARVTEQATLVLQGKLAPDQLQLAVDQAIAQGVDKNVIRDKLAKIGVGTKDKQPSINPSAKGVDVAGENMKKGMVEGFNDKQEEVRQRIEAVLNGQELKPGDKDSLNWLKIQYTTRLGGTPFWEQNQPQTPQQNP